MNELQMSAADVSKYLLSKYMMEITRQTVYNWMDTGRRNEKLRYGFANSRAGADHPTRRFTTLEWLEDFLTRSGLRPANA